jgi:hypothetical protein
VGAPAAQAQQCPLHTHFAGIEDGDDVQTIHCKCDTGYEPRGGACTKTAPTPAVRRDGARTAIVNVGDPSTASAVVIPSGRDGLPTIDPADLKRYDPKAPAVIREEPPSPLVTKPGPITFRPRTPSDDPSGTAPSLPNPATTMGGPPPSPPGQTPIRNDALPQFPRHYSPPTHVNR